MPEAERATSEVAWALGRRALDAGLYSPAEAHARQAVQADESWPDAKVLLAGVLIEKRFGRVVRNGFSKPPVSDWPDYEQVIDLLEKAIEQVKAFASASRYAPLRLNLAAAHAAVGKRELAV